MKLGVVIIGRNEGDRLRRCLGSIKTQAVPAVYVDSGSTDGSVTLARSLGVEVVELTSDQPFSAARARNTGFERCLELAPDTEAVMFVDGDCEVEPEWWAKATKELTERPELAVVCGRRREIDPDASVFNRMVDLEWNTPVGLALSCGGDALFRGADFRAVGGFDPNARAGEEPELCRRLRACGRLVARIDVPMTRHDLNMTRLSQWWRRQERFGYHALNLEHRFTAPIGPDGQPMPSLFGASLIRSRIWGIGWPVVVLGGSTAAWFVMGRWAAAGVVVLGLLILALQAIRLAWRVRPWVRSWTDGLAYGALMILDKWANFAGQVRWLLDRLVGREARLIEYRGAAGPILTARPIAKNDQSVHLKQQRVH